MRYLMYMKCSTYFNKKGSIIPIALIITTLFGAITLIGLGATALLSDLVVDMRTEPQKGILRVGESLQLQIVVESTMPVNAFSGTLTFNNSVLYVESINYNTSLADLWVKEPWYSNGDGTIMFAGGTTKKGGFTGTDTLLTVTFKASKKGSGQIAIENARILQHDGLGTDAQLQKSIDSIFIVEDKQNISNKSDVLRKNSYGTAYVVTKEKISTDLNNDGKQSIADISIFMLHLASNNLLSDFNEDGKVSIKDLNLILSAK